MSNKFVEPEGQLPDHIAARQAWMAVLAEAPSEKLKSAWNAINDADKPDVEHLRTPERGLVMVRGRAAGIGERFNLGEMTVTRSAVRMADGTTGVAYIGGRDPDHAVIAATVDAMMQSETYKSLAEDLIVHPLQANLEAAKKEAAQKTAATKVNFFTMVRTRDGK
ncbi:MAG: phosphonate C-P lyase system protein PhnG [Pseudomonadota bacterium]